MSNSAEISSLRSLARSLQAARVDELAEQLEELGLGHLALDFDSHDALRDLSLRCDPLLSSAFP